MRTHWCHTRTTTDEYHLIIGFFREELTEWTRNCHFITLVLMTKCKKTFDLEAHQVDVVEALQITHVKHNDAFLFWI